MSSVYKNLTFQYINKLPFGATWFTHTYFEFSQKTNTECSQWFMVLSHGCVPLCFRQGDEIRNGNDIGALPLYL